MCTSTCDLSAEDRARGRTGRRLIRTKSCIVAQRREGHLVRAFGGQIISPFYDPLKYKSSSKLNSSPRTQAYVANYNEHFITRACVRASGRRRRDGKHSLAEGRGNGGMKKGDRRRIARVHTCMRVCVYICVYKLYVYIYLYIYISRWDVLWGVSTYKAAERCAIDAAFFTSLDVAATFCEFRPRMPDEKAPSTLLPTWGQGFDLKKLLLEVEA